MRRIRQFSTFAIAALGVFIALSGTRASAQSNPSAMALEMASATQPGMAYPLDDSLSIVTSGDVHLKADADSPSTRNSTLARTSTRAQIILDTSAYAGMRVRIHQTMAQVGPTWVARWRMSPPFMDGQSQQGQRVLIFQGQLPAGLKRLETSANYDFSVDNYYAANLQKLRFTFDIEVLP